MRHVLKRWAAWPLGIRWLLGGIGVVLALGIAWALFVPIPDWLAHHDVGSIKGSLHETALDNARDRLLTLGAAVFAVAALVYTARNFTLSREGQVTDRYTKAIEQLGSDKLDVRIGGIYALERVARDSAKDHPTVMEVLVAFLREHSHERWPLSKRGTDTPNRATRPDVQAAVTVIGRRNRAQDRGRINLTDAELVLADLGRADLSGAQLVRVNLTAADLTAADLTDADLDGADLTHAKLYLANLTGANLALANLTNANLARASLSRAALRAANLTDANLSDAKFNDAFLGDAQLIRADLTRADLTYATLTCVAFTGATLIGARLGYADLTEADFTGADLGYADLTNAYMSTHSPHDVKVPATAPIPEGWVRNPDSGRLHRASDESGNAV